MKQVLQVYRVGGGFQMRQRGDVERRGGTAGRHQHSGEAVTSDPGWRTGKEPGFEPSVCPEKRIEDRSADAGYGSAETWNRDGTARSDYRGTSRERCSCAETRFRPPKHCHLSYYQQLTVAQISVRPLKPRKRAPVTASGAFLGKRSGVDVKKSQISQKLRDFFCNIL